MLQYRLDNGRRDVLRLSSEINRIDEKLTGVLTDLHRDALQLQKDLLLAEFVRLNRELESVSSQQTVKRHRSSYTVTVPGDKVDEAVLWRAEVVAKEVSREIVSVADLLQPQRPLLAELRWLQLKIAARKPSASLEPIKAMRAARLPGQRDLEVPYHPLLLLFYQAAAQGQSGLEFLAEDFTLSKPREDIRCIVNGARTVPQECKTECVYNNGATPADSAGIDANAEALGKLLQVVGSLTGRHRTGSVENGFRNDVGLRWPSIHCG